VRNRVFLPMPESFDISKGRAARNKREVEASRKAAKRLQREISALQRISLANTKCLPGDRTGNAPDLRMHSRQSMRFDKELSMNAYVVEPNGKYWHEDVKTTLAVITHARMIIASRKKIEHDPEKKFLIT